MKTLLRRHRTRLGLLIGLGLAVFRGSLVRGEEFEAVFSRVSNGYIRGRLSDGTFQPESYALLKGGLWGGEIADPTIDKVSFDAIGQTIAGALASQNFFPSRDPKTTRLLIVVFWGTTRELDYHEPFAPLPTPPIGVDNAPALPSPLLSESGRLSAAEVRKDTEVIVDAANLLGYPSPLDPELLSRRYFVVLLAYDFQAKLTQEKSMLLWEARFSIRERGNEFKKQLAAMARNASQYFGQDSHGLAHKPVPEGHVVVGEIRSLDVVPNAGPSEAALAPDGTHVAYLKKEDHKLKLVIVEIDRPKRPAVAEVSDFSLGPAPLRWADAGHILVARSAAGSISFDLAGKRSEPDRKTARISLAGDSADGSSEPSQAEIRALIGEKLPDREVVIVGADNARRRFLLVASGAAGPTRYFVFDRPSDLLYEVGRR